MDSLGSNADVLQLGCNLQVQGIDIFASKEVALALAQKLINLLQLLQQLRLLSFSACLYILQEVGEQA